MDLLGKWQGSIMERCTILQETIKDVEILHPFPLKAKKYF